jgi:membrane protease YdiL (CAAX protease family)
MSGHRERRPAGARPAARALVVPLLSCVLILSSAAVVQAAVVEPASRASGGERAPAGEKGESSLEAAASKAGDTGRAVAMSLIGLAFAVAATVLAFRRDFKEAMGVFAVGIVSVLLATPAGVSLLRDTVASLFGSQ